MTANPETLEKIVNTIRSEVPKYLSPRIRRPRRDSRKPARAGRRGIRPHQGHPRIRPPSWTHMQGRTGRFTWKQPAIRNADEESNKTKRR